ncbi:hypothetical protein OG244_03840 [Streptomyces brevispora]|uniref:hypothetical protein n=1 Tax=Streptomyces brevispora TaxID=887462 RepID=UPI002E3791F8|nr:hypothetical protein [Streptomyces brevispora]
MSTRTSSFFPARPARLAQSPAVRRNGQWWLVAASGAVATDPMLTKELEDLAAAMTAADRAVAALRPPQDSLLKQHVGRRR